jgi:hypothetical protein
MKINVLFALELPVAIKLRQNFMLVDRDDPDQGYIRNDLTPAQRAKLRTVFVSKHKRVTVSGTEYVILDFYFPDITVDRNSKELLWLEKLKELLPGQEFVIGAWQSNGLEYGTYIIPATIDAQGEELTPESIGGTPVYPIHNYVNNNQELIFPDVLTYDINGVESFTPATEPKQVHSIQGWSDRRF